MSELRSREKVEVAVLDSHSVLNSHSGLRGRKATLHWNLKSMTKFSCLLSKLRSFVKVEMAVLDSPSLTVTVASVDWNVKSMTKASCLLSGLRELCESQGGRPGPSVIVRTVYVHVRQH